MNPLWLLYQGCISRIFSSGAWGIGISCKLLVFQIVWWAVRYIEAESDWRTSSIKILLFFYCSCEWRGRSRHCRGERGNAWEAGASSYGDGTEPCPPSCASWGQITLGFHRHPRCKLNITNKPLTSLYILLTLTTPYSNVTLGSSWDIGLVLVMTLIFFIGVFRIWRLQMTLIQPMLLKCLRSLLLSLFWLRFCAVHNATLKKL